MPETTLSLPHRPNRLIALFSDSILLLLAFWLAFSLRFDVLYWTAGSRVWAVLAITFIPTLVVFAKLGAYQAVNRYKRNHAMIVVLSAVSISAALMFLIGFILQVPISRSVPLIYWFLALAFVGGSRIIYRIHLGQRDVHPEEI
jgi:FlaA1/EpsC-like NDP-sugar epimerase